MPEYVPVRARKHRYRQFAAKYVQNGYNGLQTVLDCGFTNNHNSAKVIASRLLTYVYVDEQITKLQSKAKMDAEEVLERLTDIARTPAEFKGSDVVKAAELLGKGHKLFVDKVETTDTSERDSLVSAIERKIESNALNSGLSSDESAVRFFSQLQSYESDHANPVNFGKYRGVIENYLRDRAEQPTIEGGEQ